MAEKSSPEPPKHIGCDFLAGWLSGIAGNIVGHPMDTVKVYQQVYKYSTLEAIGAIRKTYGLQGFYRGIPAPLITSGILNSLFFGGYGLTLAYIDQYRHLIQSEKKIKEVHESMAYKLHRGNYLDIFLAGCVAGAIQIPVSCPSELIKIKVQAIRPPQPPLSSFAVAREVMKKEGIRGFYRGVSAMLYRDIPSSGLYVLTYEYIKDLLNVHYPNESRLLHQFIAGGLAGSTSWIFVVPFDTIKSQMQVGCGKVSTKTTLTSAFVSNFKTQGFAGLTRGTIPISIRAFPVNGATFMVYEYFYKRCMEDEVEKDQNLQNHHHKCVCVRCVSKKNCMCRKL